MLRPYVNAAYARVVVQEVPTRETDRTTASAPFNLPLARESLSLSFALRVWPLDRRTADSKQSIAQSYGGFQGALSAHIGLSRRLPGCNLGRQLAETHICQSKEVRLIANLLMKRTCRKEGTVGKEAGLDSAPRRR